MKLPGTIINLSLLLLFIISILLRTGGALQSDSLYYRGESAVNYRYAFMIGESGHLPKLDRKASLPEGIQPAHVKANGAEYFTGYLYRLVKYFSGMNERAFSRLLTVFFYSLLIFFTYAITIGLWNCQSGGLFASFLIAVSAPLVTGTTGSEYLHTHYAAVIIALHILLLIRYQKKPVMYLAIASALTALGLFAVWEISTYYIAFVIAFIVFKNKDPNSDAIKLAGLHFAAFIAAATFIPYLGARHALISGPAPFIYTALLLLVVKSRINLRGPGVLYLLFGGIFLGFLLSFFQPRDTALISYWPYLQHRIQYLFTKPGNPLSLPDEVRFLWTLKNASPGPYDIFAYFFPLLFFVPPVIAGIRAMRKNNGTPLTAPLILVVICVVACIFNRSAIIIASLGVFVFVSSAMFSFRKDFFNRVGFFSIGVLLILTQTIQPGGRLDLTNRFGKLFNLSPEKSNSFTWVSIGDAELDLIKFLAARTSTRSPFIASQDLSPLILTFGGRSTMMMPGVPTKIMVSKTCHILGSLYRDEQSLYQTCKQMGADYVLYSIDLLFDHSKYSPKYLAGVDTVAKESAVFKMNFFPETLDHFNLVYENDNFRVFKVIDTPGPVFLSDHPPIYQYDVLEKGGDSLESFNNRIIRVLSTYAVALEAMEAGNGEDAVRLLQECINEVPRFTAARNTLGAILLELNRLEEAKAVFLSIIHYAPDSFEALYNAALTLARLGENNQARTYLDLLLSSTPDPDMARKARILRRSLR